MARPIGILLLALLTLLPAWAGAQGPEEVTAGSLLLRAGDGYRTATRLETAVEMRISGMVARVTVRQSFVNPGRDWAEGVYVFPLPEDAAVDRLRLRVGERVIEGEIQEREQARRRYQQARQAGQRASLVEQERPNLFTSSVANIGPGERVQVEIGYLQTVRYAAGSFSLRFPMTLTPRYVPGRPQPALELSASGSGWARPTDQVPDADRITPPMRHPASPGGATVSLTAELDPGLPLAALESRYHPIAVERRGERYHLRLQQGAAPANRDFELVWTPAVGRAPAAALFSERVAGQRYALVMLLPPTLEQASRTPRETIFVIDTSGSMGGASIRQARRALDLALQRLDPGDRFNVIEFNSGARALFPDPVPAAPHHREQARRAVARLAAGGGTEMAPALALALAGRPPEGYLRQIVFITDGAVGNEEALFAQIHRDLGQARLFTVGIGSAPNGHFMRRAARFGRGSHTYIGELSEVGARMQALFAQLEHPVLKDLAVDLPAGSEPYPARLPDLYAGEPVLLSLRLPATGGAVEVRGELQGRPWRRRLMLDGGAEHPGVAAVWARRKIAALMDAVTTGADPQATRQAVVDVALQHHLVSRYTSLVAVDRTPARSAQARLRRQAIANELPAGSDPRAWPLAYARTATAAPLHLVAGLALLLAALLLLLARRLRP